MMLPVPTTLVDVCACALFKFALWHPVNWILWALTYALLLRFAALLKVQLFEFLTSLASTHVILLLCSYLLVVFVGSTLSMDTMSAFLCWPGSVKVGSQFGCQRTLWFWLAWYFNSINKLIIFNMWWTYATTVWLERWCFKHITFHW